MTAAGGLSLADLARRLPERRLPWLAGVVLDQVAAGRVTCDPDGRYRLVPRAFEGDVLRALRSLDREAMRRAPA